jgi:hypothetical protein
VRSRPWEKLENEGGWKKKSECVFLLPAKREFRPLFLLHRSRDREKKSRKRTRQDGCVPSRPPTTPRRGRGLREHGKEKR